MHKVLLLLLLLLPACISQRRCLQRYGPTLVRETEQVHDTVVVTPAARLDTRWLSRPLDTLSLHQGKAEVRIVRMHDTLRVQAACHPDTLRIPVVRVRTRWLAPPETNHASIWLWLILGAAASILLRLLIKKII